MSNDIQLLVDPNVIQVRNAEKSFINSSSKKPLKVFSKLNINVPYGKIYSLLGPSGCGKTTILRCIVGREKLDKGHVLICGKPPGSKGCWVPGRNVGYMPQETCIFDTMTIAECFMYYGVILGLSNDKIRTRIKYYEKILKLPSVDTVTTCLSGGQGRRVSFAIALFHHPKLIVLDEPTVGIDPIVKFYMWKHLLELTKTKNISIILTTHYIEEARQSHVVGVMNDGQMAAEDSAENLISKFNCQSLEDVCLLVCFGESNETGFRKPEARNKNTGADACEKEIRKLQICEIPESTQQRSSILSYRDLTIRWRPLQSVIRRYMLFLFRFPGGLIFLMSLPSFIILIFHLTMSGKLKDITVIVVNDDQGQLGTRYLSKWDQNALIQINSSSLQAAKLDLRDGKAYGMLHIGQNFSEMLIDRINRGPFASEEVLTKSKLNLTVVDINFHIKMLIAYQLYSSMEKLLHTVTNTSRMNSPIMFNKELYSFLEKPSMQYVTRPIVLLAIYYGAGAGTVMVLFVEMSKGYMERGFVAGTTIAELISGLMLVEFMVVGAQSIIAQIILLFFFDGLSTATWIVIFTLLFGTGVSGTSYGVFVSLAFPNLNQLVMVAATSVIISGAVAGVLWPVEAMPAYFRYICNMTPLLLPHKAFNIIMNNKWQLFYGEVLLGFTTLSVWFLLCILVSLKFLHLLK